MHFSIADATHALLYMHFLAGDGPLKSSILHTQYRWGTSISFKMNAYLQNQLLLFTLIACTTHWAKEDGWNTVCGDQQTSGTPLRFSQWVSVLPSRARDRSTWCISANGHSQQSLDMVAFTWGQVKLIYSCKSNILLIRGIRIINRKKNLCLKKHCIPTRIHAILAACLIAEAYSNSWVIAGWLSSDTNPQVTTLPCLWPCALKLTSVFFSQIVYLQVRA